MRRLGRFLFRARNWTAVPLVFVFLLIARPQARLILIGSVILLAGEALRVAGLTYLDATARGSRFHAGALATGGPFRFVRNPIYLGNATLVAGLCVAGGVRSMPFLAITAILLLIQYGSIIAGEEEFLAGRFPGLFARYRARVPRVIPSLRGFEEPSAPRRPIRDVLRAEFRTLHTIGLLLSLLALKSLVATGS